MSRSASSAFPSASNAWAFWTASDGGGAACPAATQWTAAIVVRVTCHVSRFGLSAVYWFIAARLPEVGPFAPDYPVDLPPVRVCANWPKGQYENVTDMQFNLLPDNLVSRG